MFEQRKTEKFVPDREVFAPEVVERIPPKEARSALWRHICGDWGELDPYWCAKNEEALKTCDGTKGNSQEELNSIFTASNGVKFCVTTVLNVAPLTLVYIPDGDEYFLSPPSPPRS